MGERLGNWWPPAGVSPTLERGSGKELQWWAATALLLQHKNEGSFHTNGLAQSFAALISCLSPQHHPFSKSQDPGKECSQSASCSAFAFIWICCKKKTYLQWKRKEASLFLPYRYLYWKPKGEILCSIESRLVLIRLIQLRHKTTIYYLWLQSKLNQPPGMHMVTWNSKALANTVSNHYLCFQISSLHKHFFSKLPILFHSTYRTAE